VVCLEVKLLTNPLKKKSSYVTTINSYFNRKHYIIIPILTIKPNYGRFVFYITVDLFMVIN